MSLNYHFDVSHAVLYGVNESIILSNIVHWIWKNKSSSKNYFEGRTWTYNTYKSFCNLFPFWTPRQIRYAIKNLVDSEVLITRQNPGSDRNKGLFYALKDESIFMPVKKHESYSQNNKKLSKSVTKLSDGVTKLSDPTNNTYVNKI